ncbi:MAG: DUF5017 domain-containing protein [Limnohabitans sp.]|nr:DUF5017 domain-containing protein [Limnohabitans sp.]
MAELILLTYILTSNLDSTMKSFKSILFFTLPFVMLSSCTKDDSYEIPPVRQVIFEENFNANTDGTILDTPNWTNISQQGTKKWTEEVFSGNGYAEFTSFSSGQPLNVAWLISPEIDMDAKEGEKLAFQTAHSFLTSRDNTIELMVSKDFDGTNFAAASWVKVPANMVSPDDTRFVWINSGEVDFSKLTGKIHFAFKVSGSGTNTNLDATFQLDNIRLYTTK